MATESGIVRPIVVSPEVVAAEVVRRNNDLAGLSDDFSAGMGQWTLYEGDGTAVTSTSGGQLNLTCNAGGAGDSLWFQSDEGILWYQLISGNFDAVATVRVRNLANDGLPTVGDGNFRVGVLAAHDPDRSTNLDYVHVGLGCIASAGIEAEYKSTVASVSSYASVPAPTGVGVLRIRRIGQLFSLYIGTTLLQAYDRTAAPLPATLQVGLGVYASVASHDLRMLVDSVTFTRL